MPAQKYTLKPPVYDCIQFDGGNFEEIKALGAPVTEEDNKVYLETPMGRMPVSVSDWVTHDIYNMFALCSDVNFQKGFELQ